MHKYDYKADETAEYPYIQVLGQFPDPGEITNLFGRTSAIASKSGNIWQVELFSYDVHGHIIKKWVLTENASTIDTRYLYTYDRQGNLITRHDRIGNSPYYNFSYYHWYDYDVMGNLTSVYSGDASSKPTIPDVIYTYTPAGGKASEEFKGNLNQAFTYDLRGRLSAIGDVTNTGRPFGASYSWSGAENITSAEFSQSGTPHAHKRYRYSFVYDNLNRLTSAQYAWFSGGTFTGSSAWQLESVAYDAAGNITSLKRRNQGGTLWHHYSLQYPAGNNRLTSYQNHAPGFQDLYSLQYDANGNVTHIENADYTLWVDMTWDPYNRMTTYQETNNGITTWYRYNASGSRYYKKTGAAAPVYTIRDGLAAVAVLGTGTSFTIRKPDGEVIGFKPYNTIKSWYLKDHLGSTRTRVGENGAVQEVLDYYPFGLEMPGRGMVTGAATPWRFTGYERDPESFLDYAQARYYHPGIGRFWSVDPMAGDYPDWSPYSYVLNNPVQFTDPFGLCPIDYIDDEMGAVCKEVVVTAARSRDVLEWQRVSSNAWLAFFDAFLDQLNYLDAGQGSNKYIYARDSRTGDYYKAWDGVKLSTGTPPIPAFGALKAARGGSVLARASKSAFKAADDAGSIFIKNKHLNIGSGKFAKFNTSDIGTARGIVQDALRSPNAQFLPNPNLPNTFRVHTNLGRVVGTKGQTSVRVIVGFDGKVINAFPIK